MSTSRNDRTLFSIGDCPVCADSGAVLVLRSNASNQLIFFCPLCGVAWPTPPVDRRLDSIRSLEDVAPQGISLPSEGDLLDLRRAGKLQNVDYSTWQRDLQPLLIDN